MHTEIETLDDQITPAESIAIHSVDSQSALEAAAKASARSKEPAEKPEPAKKRPSAKKRAIQAAKTPALARGGRGGARGVAPKRGGATKGKPDAKSAKPAKKASSTTKGAASDRQTKQDQVVELMRRPEGATITEIMRKMGWQRHTVRGFVAGALKKAGYNVESFKPEGGERSYRIKGDK